MMQNEWTTVHYRSPDPIQNLRVRVTLTRVGGSRRAHASVLPARRLTEDEDEAEAEAGSMEEEAKLIQDTAYEVDGEPITMSRVFGWQEKVFSTTEVAVAQAPIEEDVPNAASLRHSLRLNSTLGTSAYVATAWRHWAAQPLRRKYHEQIVGPGGLLEKGEAGSRLFTYVHADEFCETAESERRVTTSRTEHLNPLVQVVFTKSNRHNQVMNFQTMYVMADCTRGRPAKGKAQAGMDEHLLVHIKAHPDGSFDMRPGFSQGSRRYRFEDSSGYIYEFTVENAAKVEPIKIEKKDGKLQSAVQKRAHVLHRQPAREFMAPPDPTPHALRLLLLAEIVAAKDFERDRLFVDYTVRYDAKIWQPVGVSAGKENQEPGILQGVTQASMMTLYPRDKATGGVRSHVAHFAHPIELELQAGKEPGPAAWPTIVFQVCTYDTWHRYTTEGYGWLSLGGCCPGSRTHYVSTWRPALSIRERMRSFFTGGTPELNDVTYAKVPAGFEGQLLSKFGFQTESSGTLKVRTNAVILQQRLPPARHKASPTKPLARKPQSLAAVIERARQRLKAAHVEVPEPKRSADPPVIKEHPRDLRVHEHADAEFSCSAVGGEPLQYAWFKDGRRMRTATSRKPVLIIPQCADSDVASYMCKVSNADGQASSTDARLELIYPEPEPLPLADEGGDPFFLEHPRDASVPEGGTVELWVRAEGREPLHYQWHYKGRPLAYQTRPRLRIPNARAANEGNYTCEVTNNRGNVMSNDAWVHVEPHVPEPEPEPDLGGEPLVVTHPRDVHVPEGAPFKLSVRAEGRLPLQYCWLFSGRELPRYTQPDMEVPEARMTDIGKYACEVSNELGRVRSNEASVMVEQVGRPPFFLEHPRDVTVMEGEPWQLAVQADGLRPLHFQWHKKGAPLERATRPSLVVEEAALGDAGDYTCEVHNAKGAVVSRPANVRVLKRPQQVMFLEHPHDVTVEEGLPWQLAVRAEGARPLQYQWFSRGQAVAGWTDARARVAKAAMSDGGLYTCEVTSAEGMVAMSNPGLVTVLEGGVRPTIIEHPKDTLVDVGGLIELHVVAEGTPPLEYQWFWRNDVPMEGAVTSSLLIDSATPKHAGSYWCEVRNHKGVAVSDKAAVEIHDDDGRPRILEGPQDQHVTHLGTVDLHVVAAGWEPLRYQWYYNGEALGGQTRPRLVLERARKATHQGVYTVQVGNEVDSVLSNEAYVLVEAVDIFHMIEKYVEEQRTTFKNLFMQFNRKKDHTLGGKELEALVRLVYPEVQANEIRHFKVMVDTDGAGSLSYKKLAMAMKECKEVGAYVTGDGTLQTLITHLAVRMADQGNNFRKVFMEFDKSGSGELAYEEIVMLIRRQLPQLNHAELRALVNYLHEIDVDGNGKLSYNELWTAVQRAPILRAARRDLRRVAGLAKTPAEKEAALRRAHTHKKTFSAGLELEDFSP
ncbi:hypothetical protein WJX72_009110 [[Myrmecia] bisecta]|uniref:Uncharacterized protein n=1 Tax=[Myrmecia] bisecta TaxID=41462 RepID=A0AAW1QS44_9CHLO